jgi:hypothetical protein
LDIGIRVLSVVEFRLLPPIAATAKAVAATVEGIAEVIAAGGWVVMVVLAVIIIILVIIFAVVGYWKSRFLSVFLWASF